MTTPSEILDEAGDETEVCPRCGGTRKLDCGPSAPPCPDCTGRVPKPKAEQPSAESITAEQAGTRRRIRVVQTRLATSPAGPWGTPMLEGARVDLPLSDWSSPLMMPRYPGHWKQSRVVDVVILADLETRAMESSVSEPIAEVVAAELRAEAALILEQEGWLIGRAAHETKSARFSDFYDRYRSWREKVKAFRASNPNAWPEPPDNS
jgi:hypothetical protein